MYRNIVEKKHTNVDSNIADFVRAELNKQGVKYSGLINDNNKTTFTTSFEDSDKVKAAVEKVKTAVKGVRKPNLTDRLSEKKEQAARLNANREKPDKTAKSRGEEL
jgi:preprotein translocase subunit SecD